MSKTYCFFSAQYLPTVGGVERYTYNLAKNLIEKGEKVIVVTSCVPNLPDYEKTGEGIIIYRMPCFLPMNGRMPIIKLNKIFKKLKEQLLNENIDYAVLQTHLYVNSVFGAYLMAKNNIPTILIDHCTDHVDFASPIINVFGQIYEHILSFLIKIKCKNFYGVSNDTTQWLKHYNIKCKGVLYNSVDTDNLKVLADSSSANFRGKYNIDDEAKIVVYSSRLIKEKGIYKLIDAFNMLLDDNINAHLLIAGDGPLMSEIKSFESEKISALGSLEYKDNMALLSQSDIYVLPTDYPEGFPTGVLEAASFKKFIITTNKGGSKELVIDKDYGVVLSENTVDNLYKAMKNAVQNEVYVNEAVNRTYSRLTDNFTWDVVSEKLQEIFKSIKE